MDWETLELDTQDRPTQLRARLPHGWLVATRSYLENVDGTRDLGVVETTCFVPLAASGEWS